MQVKAQLMDERAMQRALTRIAHEIVERNKGTENLVLIGVRRRGVPLAQRLSAAIAEIEQSAPPPVGTLDIAFYRDDLSTRAEQPEVSGTDEFAMLAADVNHMADELNARIDEYLDEFEKNGLNAVTVDL